MRKGKSLRSLRKGKIRSIPDIFYFFTLYYTTTTLLLIITAL